MNKIIKLLSILLLISSIATPCFALTEQEEFELYKEFKKQKALKKTSTQQGSSNTNIFNKKEDNDNSYRPSTYVNYNQNYLLYTDQAKNEWLAVGGAWFLPTLGHAYAGDWGRGVPFLLAELVGLGLVVTSVKTETEYDTYLGRDEEVSEINAGQFLLGISTFLVARIWEYFDAYDTAGDFNRDLKKKYGLTFNAEQGTPTIMASLEF